MKEEKVKLEYYQNLIQKHEVLSNTLKMFVEKNKESEDLDIKIKIARFDIEVTEIDTKLYFYQQNFDHYSERVRIFNEQKAEDLEKMGCLANWHNLRKRVQNLSQSKNEHKGLITKINNVITNQTYSKEYDLWKITNQLLNSHNF
jgi:hypothetical protein